jgi:uncharacterized DUF497 family protein
VDHLEGRSARLEGSRVRKVWVFNPHTGGRKIPPATQNEVRKRILEHAQRNYAGKHSVSEERWAAFGKTDAHRFLVVIFTKRNNLIRIISGRDMNRRERTFYDEKG